MLTQVFTICLFCWLFLCSFSHRHIQTEKHSIHILEIDPSLYQFVPARALDMGLGREEVASIASRKSAIGAINGGFFAIGGTYDGTPRGLLKIEDKWYGLPKKPRGAIGWKKDGKEFLFDRLLARARVTLNGTEIKVDGLNESRSDDQIILYGSDFGFTTLTQPGGVEFLITDGQFKEVGDKGSARLPQNGWVLSFGRNRLSELPKDMKDTSFAEVQIHIVPQEYTQESSAWDQMDYVVGGTPLLICEGKKIEDFSAEKTIDTFLYEPHARSAVGILPNRNWVFVTVDKEPELGMTIPEWASFMEKIGCVFALNLDGGGSSTLVIENQVINTPAPDKDSNEKIRRVSDAILILKR